jgi:hypothetical protein
MQQRGSDGIAAAASGHIDDATHVNERRPE